MSLQFVAYVPSARGAGWGWDLYKGYAVAFVSLVNAQLFVFKN